MGRANLRHKTTHSLICFGGLALIERLQETASQAALEQHLGTATATLQSHFQLWKISGSGGQTNPCVRNLVSKWNKRVKLCMLWIFKAMSSYTCASQVLGPWGVTVRRCWKRRFARLVAVEWFLWSWFSSSSPILKLFLSSFRQLDWVGAETSHLSVACQAFRNKIWAGQQRCEQDANLLDGIKSFSQILESSSCIWKLKILLDSYL